MTPKQPIEHANHILSTFTPVRLMLDSWGKLWVVGPPFVPYKNDVHPMKHIIYRPGDLPRRAIPARITENGYLAGDSGSLEMGGTTEQCVAALIAWVRGERGQGIGLFRYAAQPNVLCTNLHTLELCERYGFGKAVPPPEKEGA